MAPSSMQLAAVVLLFLAAAPLQRTAARRVADLNIPRNVQVSVGLFSFREYTNVTGSTPFLTCADDPVKCVP